MVIRNSNQLNIATFVHQMGHVCVYHCEYYICLYFENYLNSTTLNVFLFFYIHQFISYCSPLIVNDIYYHFTKHFGKCKARDKFTLTIVETGNIFCWFLRMVLHKVATINPIAHEVYPFRRIMSCALK